MEVSKNFINAKLILLAVNNTGEVFREKWYKTKVADDMVPVKMTDTDVGGFGRILFQQKGITQRYKASSHIKYNEFIIRCTDFHAGCMSANFNFISVRSGERSPYTPEFYNMFSHDEEKIS